MAKKKRTYTREEKKGKRKRQRVASEPEGVPEDFECEEMIKEVRSLLQWSIVPENHGRRIRIKPVGSAEKRSFVHSCEPTAWDFIYRLMKIREFAMLLNRRQVWLEKRLREVRAVEQDETLIRESAGHAIESVNAKLREEKDVSAQLRKKINELELELKR